MLYFIRHTQIKLTEGTCYGRLDIPLAGSYFEERALVKARLARLLSDTPVEQIEFHTSPLGRCEALAQYLAVGAAISADDRLLEMNFGDWEGKPWAEIPVAEVDAWAKDTAHYVVPNGESYRDVESRCADFLLELASDKTHVIVTHAGVIKACIKLIKKQSLKQVLKMHIGFGEIISL